MWIRPCPRLPDTQIWLRPFKQRRPGWNGGKNKAEGRVWKWFGPEGFIKVRSVCRAAWDWYYLLPEALDTKQHSPVQTCESMSQLNRTYIYCMPHLQTNRRFHHNHLFFWSLPAPLPIHTRRVHDNAISAAAEGEAPAGRRRAGCCRSLQWRSHGV